MDEIFIFSSFVSSLPVVSLQLQPRRKQTRTVSTARVRPTFPRETFHFQRSRARSPERSDQRRRRFAMRGGCGLVLRALDHELMAKPSTRRSAQGQIRCLVSETMAGVGRKELVARDLNSSTIRRPDDHSAGLPEAATR